MFGTFITCWQLLKKFAYFLQTFLDNLNPNLTFLSAKGAVAIAYKFVHFLNIMDLFEFDYDSSSDSDIDADYLADDLELELFENRERPKNENYIEETVQHFSETEFIEHFRLSRHVANTIAEQYEQSNFFNPQSGGNGKISAMYQVYIFL